MNDETMHSSIICNPIDYLKSSRYWLAAKIQPVYVQYKKYAHTFYAYVPHATIT